MRPAADPTDADLVALRALRAGRDLPADATDAVVLADVVFAGALLAAATFEVLVFAAFLVARAAVVLAAVVLAAVVLAAVLRDAAAFAADFVMAVRCLAADWRAGFAAAWRLRWLSTITHSSSVSEDGLLPCAFALSLIHI